MIKQYIGKNIQLDDDNASVLPDGLSLTNDLTITNGDINNSGENGGVIHTNVVQADTVKVLTNLQASSLLCGTGTLNENGILSVTSAAATTASIIVITPLMPVVGTCYITNLSVGTFRIVSNSGSADEGVKVAWFIINPIS